MTAAIGAFFTDLDLDIYHAAPRRKLTLVIFRWMKTLAQSATIIFAFIVPMFVAFARQYDRPWTFYPIVLVNLALLLTIPVTLGSLAILLLVRWFPVQRVHQIVATIAILVLTTTVVAFRVSRPERLFTEVTTDNLVAVLRAIELPSIDLYPGTAIADIMVSPVPPAFPPSVIAVAALSSCCSHSPAARCTSSRSCARGRAWHRWRSARSR